MGLGLNIQRPRKVSEDFDQEKLRASKIQHLKYFFQNKMIAQTLEPKITTFDTDVLANDLATVVLSTEVDVFDVPAVLQDRMWDDSHFEQCLILKHSHFIQHLSGRLSGIGSDLVEPWVILQTGVRLVRIDVLKV